MRTLPRTLPYLVVCAVTAAKGVSGSGASISARDQKNYVSAAISLRLRRPGLRRESCVAGKGAEGLLGLRVKKVLRVASRQAVVALKLKIVLQAAAAALEVVRALKEVQVSGVRLQLRFA